VGLSATTGSGHYPSIFKESKYSYFSCLAKHLQKYDNRIFYWAVL